MSKLLRFLLVPAFGSGVGSCISAPSAFVGPDCSRRIYNIPQGPGMGRDASRSGKALRPFVRFLIAPCRILANHHRTSPDGLGEH